MPANPFIGQTIMFGGNFAPRQWAFCDGGLWPISEYTTLFSILGTTFGGDGRTTFGLPDMRSRVPVHPGNGPGLSSRGLGARGGAEEGFLRFTNTLPNHSHTMAVTVAPSANSGEGDADTPAGGVPAAHPEDEDYAEEATAGVSMAPFPASATTGGSQPHNNVQPFECVNFIIALSGVYPSRS
jgi:microcystin-dependent protein